MLTFIINILGLFAIGFIMAWFWRMKSKATKKINNAQGVVNVVIENGVYKPNRIQATLNQPITLRFIRQDATPCAETIVFADFNISKQLPLQQITDITLIPDKKGEFTFACSMNMYQGKLIVQ